MITIIETKDGRLLVTEREDVDAVIQEAIEDCVDVGNQEEVEERTCTSKENYVLIEIDRRISFDGPCRPRKIYDKPTKAETK